MSRVQEGNISTQTEGHSCDGKACVASVTGNSTVHTCHQQDQVWSRDDNNMSAPGSWLSFEGLGHGILPGKLQECQVFNWEESGRPM